MTRVKGTLVLTLVLRSSLGWAEAEQRSTDAAGEMDCSRCHTTASFQIPAFNHDQLTAFPLRGQHRGLRCAECHHQVTLANHAEVRLYRLGIQSCDGCHESGHKGLARRSRGRSGAWAVSAAGASAEQHEKALREEMARCDGCHRATGWRDIVRADSFDHALVGYPLLGRHASVACSSCHKAEHRLTRQCSGCHADPHRGRLGTRCAECHSVTNWRASQVLEAHRKTRFPLTGMHALADCTSCHPVNRQPAFRGAPTACFACHAAQYLDPSVHPNHAHAGFSRDCAQCHRTTGWKPAAFTSQTSALVAHQRFPLTGSHVHVGCMSCHATRDRPSPRCVSCHQEALQRALEPSHQASDFLRCEQCHQTTRWKPAEFIHHARRFPLTGRHARLDCADCHIDSSRMKTFTCTASCHPVSAMAQRHANTPGFSPADLACKRCHPMGRR